MAWNPSRAGLDPSRELGRFPRPPGDRPDRGSFRSTETIPRDSGINPATRKTGSEMQPRSSGDRPPRADSVDTAGATVPELHGRDRPKAKREQPTSPHRRGSTRRSTRPGADMDRSATPHERGSTESGRMVFHGAPPRRGLTPDRASRNLHVTPHGRGSTGALLDLHPNPDWAGIHKANSGPRFSRPSQGVARQEGPPTAPAVGTSSYQPSAAR